MNSWKATPRTPAKTKQELREMLAQAVRNTQPETETKPLPKAKKVAGHRSDVQRGPGMLSL